MITMLMIMNIICTIITIIITVLTINSSNITRTYVAINSNTPLR